MRRRWWRGGSRGCGMGFCEEGVEGEAWRVEREASLRLSPGCVIFWYIIHVSLHRQHTDYESD